MDSRFITALVALLLGLTVGYQWGAHDASADAISNRNASIEQQFRRLRVDQEDAFQRLERQHRERE